jgi:PilZ domain
MPVKLETAKQERRKAPRVKLPRCVRVRPFDFRLSQEVCMTANVSRTGLYIETPAEHYYTGMNVSVVRNFQPEERVHREETGTITRIEKLENGRWGVAIRILPISARPSLGRSR